MIDPSLTPPRPLRILANIARWSLRLVLVFWLLVAAAWVTLHGLIVPRIGEWRVEVEQIATQALGTPVRIGQITGQSNGVFPTLHLSDVRISDALGRDGLVLQRVVATVSVRSLLRRGLEQLYIEAPELDMRRLADGRWLVAGVELLANPDANPEGSPVLEWLLEQPEIVIRQGRVQWTDEQRGVAAVQFRDVDFVMRNRHWNHVLRLDATPVAYAGEQLQLVGAFRQPLLSASRVPWSDWHGQWYAALHLQHLPALPWPAAWGVEAAQGRGAARAWVDVEHGQVVGVVVDAALPQARLQWSAPQVADLEVQQLQGRLRGRWQAQGWQLSAQDFSFQTSNGAHWPASRWSVQHQATAASPVTTALAFDYVDVGMAAALAQALPLPSAVQTSLVQWAPQGELHQLQVEWQEDGAYAASGQVRQLTLQPQWAHSGAGTPGVDGLDASFRFNAEGGEVQAEMQSGTLYFPGVFEEPAIPLDHLQAQVRWQMQEGRLKVEVPQAQFANADAQGSFHGFWQMGEQATARLPGELQLQGQLTQANGARVYRYLPLEIPEQARHYVRDSVLQGQGQDVEFEVRGPLQDLPFDVPGRGRFWIKAPVHDVVYAFVPPALHEGTGPAWPALNQLSGTLVFDGSSMEVQQAHAGFVGHPQLHMRSVQARIPDLSEPHLSVQAAGTLDLQATLRLVEHSPLDALTSHALQQAQAQGRADVAFALDLPIEDLAHSKVQGQVSFHNNSLQFNPDTPQMHRLQGRVQFSEQGFALHDVHGQSLGGAFQISGGMVSAAQGLHMTAQGTATAAGLQAEAAMPVVASLARYAQGTTAYTVEVTAQDGAQSVAVQSDLQGLDLDLPAPLRKPGADAAGLGVLYRLSPQHIQEIRVEMQGRGVVSLVQDVAAQPAKLLRGYVMLGHMPHAVPLAQGVAAYIQLPTLDADAWLRVVREAMPAAAGDATASAAQSSTWMPNRLRLAVEQLRLQERTFDAVTADVTQRDGVWQGQFSAEHFAGRIVYQTPRDGHEQGHLFARFAHLSLPQSVAEKLNELPVQSTTSASAPEALPALDIEVEQLEVAGKALGSLQLKARNTAGVWGRDWLLEQLDLTTDEARWRAHGRWGANAAGQARTTHLQFVLDMESSGQLLDRLGMTGVIRDGKGRLHGAIAWQGAPITPHWQSMDGEVRMDVEKGQFLKVEPGMGKLLSVLSLQSLTRRIHLDFRDVFSQGFAFDDIRGDIAVQQGVARTNNLQMKGLNAAVLMEGSANLAQETQDLTVVVVPEINAMTASLAATAIHPVIGVGSLVAQMLLRGPLMAAATRTFSIRGTWSDPLVEPVPAPATVPASTVEAEAEQRKQP